MFALTLVCLASVAAAQQPDQLAAARVLGPHWKQLSRSAGMVFAGTVLGIEELPARSDRPVPTIQVRFRVDRTIAGVQPGQVLTIREWAGAWSTHRGMRTGQRMLLFLYPPSRLGLTSPVGGALGQIALDPNRKIVATPAPAPANAIYTARTSRPPTRTVAAPQSITVRQLERAIRSARKDKE
ncbi:MAG: hypothetical protein HY233_02055 [Acidobacteriales bacterium]|nr:hypothetical protein [Terriglobales bacterium]